MYKSEYMGFFSNVFETTDPANASKGIFDFLGFGSGKGTVATPKKALTISAFYNGVNILANDVAKLPKAVFKKDGDNRNVYSDHPVNYLISKKPNDLMTAFDFWKVIVVLVVLKGNAFVHVKRHKASGDVEQLVLLDNGDVEVSKKEGKLFYNVKGNVEPLHGSDVLHFKVWTFDGIMGVSVVKFAARNLGVNLDSQDYISEVYKDRGIGYAVIETEMKVDKGQKTAIEDAISSKLAGGNKYRLPVLDSGFKYKSINVTPAEAQFLETNQYGVLEVARWLNIAPHKLKHLENSNFSNMYQQSIEHVQDSILPWLTSFELELETKLFAERDGSVYVKFNEKALLRGDLESKRNYYSTMVFSGIMTRNEVRALEELNPLDGLDEPLTPVNVDMMEFLIAKNKKELKDE